MKKSALALSVILIGICFIASGLAFAAPTVQPFNWGKEVNPSSCPKGKVVVNISHDVINSADSGHGGNWAKIDYKKYITIIQTDDTEFCVVTKFVGTFTTVEGKSPANQEDISAGITGTFQGGYRQTYTGTLNPNPTWPTKGYIGTFDHAWDGTGAPDKTVDDWEDIYLSGWAYSYEWWGFIYHGGPNGTWINSQDGDQGDITD
jgi:hypothetical protein